MVLYCCSCRCFKLFFFTSLICLYVLFIFFCNHNLPSFCLPFSSYSVVLSFLLSFFLSFYFLRGGDLSFFAYLLPFFNFYYPLSFFTSSFFLFCNFSLSPCSVVDFPLVCFFAYFFSFLLFFVCLFLSFTILSFPSYFHFFFFIFSSCF